MRKRSAPFIQTFVILCGLLFGHAQTGSARTAQEPDEEQWEVPNSRSFGDNIWKENRRKEPQRRPTKRRKYERVGVAGNSATPIRYGKPGQGGGALFASKRRRPSPAKPPVWQDVLFDTSEQVGVTVWRLRKCGSGGGTRCFLELHNERGDSAMYEALRVSTATDFRAGDGIQLAVESRARGFVYVLHQEVYADGRTGEPKLLFPQREGVNAVAPGHPLLVPAQGEDGAVKVLKMRNTPGRRLAAERLRVIIVPQPLEGLFVQERPRSISKMDVQGWESLWAGRLEMFDLVGGGTERMSLNEWHAMRGGGARDLTTEDLSPQKLYVVERKRSDGVLFTLDLPYGN
ncbi:MAG TPA: hypothetical protein VF297_20370 [Pyrinomonadaceae bacterium]